MFEFFIFVLSFEKWAVLAFWCIKRPAATCEQRLSSGRAPGQSTVRAAGHARVCAWVWAASVSHSDQLARGQKENVSEMS